jgi:hypothetical protein
LSGTQGDPVKTSTGVEGAISSPLVAEVHES